MKKFLSIAMTFILLAGLAAGCGKTNTDQSNTAQTNATDQTNAVSTEKNTSASEMGSRKQIKMWFWGAATDYQEHMKKVLYDWYNKSQNQYELVIEFRNTVDTDIPKALASGSGPDIVYASGPSYTSVYAQENLVLDLSKYVQQYGWKDKILDVIYNAFTVKGKLYSIPGGMNIGGLYYNKKTFEKNGWEPPKTIEEMEALMDKAKAAGLYPLGAGNKGWKPCNDHFSSMIINHLGSPQLFYNALTGTTSFNTPEMVKAVKKSAEWYDKGYLGGKDYMNLDSQEVMQTLQDGRSAMVMAPSLYTQFAAQSFQGDDAENVGFVPMPTVNTDKTIYDISVNCNFSINAASKYPDEAAKIMDYMLSSDYVSKMTEGWPGYWAVPIKNVDEINTDGMKGLAKTTIDSLKEAVKAIDQGYFAYHPSTFFPAATLTAYEDIDTVWQGVKTPEEFCESVDKELQSDIKQNLVNPLVKPAE